VTILLAGSTGTIGKAVFERLRLQEEDVFCPGRSDLATLAALKNAFEHKRISAVISCISTRSGAPEDAWAVDYNTQLRLMTQAADAGVERFILLSAICVQKPMLAFQHAKCAFEQTLIASGLTYSIIRPTAFFKSLSGQVGRVQSGKPFFVFGDGRLTACKPISDRDLAQYLVDCLGDSSRHNRILPIGGPGPAITPLDQATRLFEMAGTSARVRHVPVAMLRGIAGGLNLAGRLSKGARIKAEFARTGLYYATESMLVWNDAAQCYDVDATPAFGSDTLWDHYDALLCGKTHVDLGAHAVFESSR